MSYLEQLNNFTYVSEKKKETYHRLVLVIWVGCFIDGNKPGHACLDKTHS